MAAREFRRPAYDVVAARLGERRRFIQVLSGPRQSGKTTLARQVLSSTSLPSHYASADDVAAGGRGWIETHWDLARLRARESRGAAVLVLDEVQKIPGWSETVKREWDRDTAGRARVRVMLLGWAPLLVQRGLTESLAGRFEEIRVSHWSFAEMRTAFGWDLDRYVYFGGYPGAAPLIGDRERWARYVLDSLVETTIARDVLLLSRVDKPALLRQLFRLSCEYSGQILSYQKMLGQLQDAGNTTTLAHYLQLLAGAGMVAGVEKFAGAAQRRRGSSPKLQVLNTSLITAHSHLSFRDARRDHAFWGRLVESAVGAHMMNGLAPTTAQVFYWRERGKEVDFVVRSGRKVVAIEVKSGGRRESLPGMDAFAAAFTPYRRILVGADGVSLEEFFSTPADRWIR